MFSGTCSNYNQNISSHSHRHEAIPRQSVLRRTEAGGGEAPEGVGLP
jgi:hypothetical protein